MKKRLLVLVLGLCLFDTHYTSSPMAQTRSVSADDSITSVYSLIAQLQEEAHQDNPNFEKILNANLEWKSIVLNVVKSARRPLKGNKQNQAAFKAFLPDFINTFRHSIVSKYSSADYLNKFKETTFDQKMAKIEKSKRGYWLTTPAHIDGALWTIKWLLNPRTGKVLEVNIAELCIFKTETSQATAAFNKGFAKSYQAGLDALTAIYTTK